MTTILQGDERQGDDAIIVYLLTLLGDRTLAYAIANQTFSQVHATRRHDQAQLYRIAASSAVETVRAQTLNHWTTRATLQEEAMKCMPGPQYRALLLYAHTSASYDEIGKCEGILEGTAHTRVCRAKRWLWEVLPSLRYGKPANETEFFPYLLSYLRRLLANDEQASQVAYTAIDSIRRQRARALTPFERARRFYLIATDLVVDILHKQARGEAHSAQLALALQSDALLDMPEPLRRALLLYAQDGVDYATLAKNEKLSLNAATVRVSLARTWIREHLVPLDELTLAVNAIEWAEKGAQRHQEVIQDEERPDVMPLYDRPYQHNKGLYQ